jgi:hypothetical protein
MLEKMALTYNQVLLGWEGAPRRRGLGFIF